MRTKGFREPSGRFHAAQAMSLALLAVSSLTVGCKSEGPPSTSSQTNWLVSCQSSSECGDLECVCGTCTLDCSTMRSCAELEGATCVAANSPGAVALCGGVSSPADVCAIPCDSGSCPQGTSCVAGICSPDVTPSTFVTIDTSTKHQTLIGFGASLDEDEETIGSHPERDALLDALFQQSGFRMVRVKNRFDTGAEDLQPTMTLLSEAATRLGKSPTVFLYSTTPPARLKANGSRTCTGVDVGCTLARTPDGGFDYAGFGEYWRASLQAYQDAGLTPSFVSIQSDADWLPNEYEAEACRLWATEGPLDTTLPSGEVVQAEFAGYLEALSAVKDALAGMPTPTFAAPEAGSPVMVSGYMDALSSSDYGALAFHLYLEQPIGGDYQFLDAVGGIVDEDGHPAIQSEMAESGLNTAALVHHTLVRAQASAYLQRNFVSTDLSEESHGLVGLAGDTFTLLPAYHALTHYARYTDEGWRRVDVDHDDVAVLASAWISPDEDQLTVVLVNPYDMPAAVEIRVGAEFGSGLEDAIVTRTAFAGAERSAVLGQLPSTGVVQVPSRSVVTVATP